VDFLSVAGLVVALAGIALGQVLEGGHLGSLAQGAALFIVLGGTFGAVMLQHPLPVFVRGMRMTAWALFPPPPAGAALVGQIVEWSNVSRKEGLLALERRLDSLGDPFVRDGLQLLVDGIEPDRIRAALEAEIDGFADGLRAGARVWEAAGGYAPTIGIIGAVLGLIHVMENLSDPSRLGAGIATAFVATVYGVGLANLFCLPVAGKLRALAEQRVRERELVVEGLVAIATGENPRLIQARLAGYLGNH
jgi:chemotaxis protein MotA